MFPGALHRIAFAIATILFVGCSTPYQPPKPGVKLSVDQAKEELRTYFTSPKMVSVGDRERLFYTPEGVEIRNRQLSFIASEKKAEGFHWVKGEPFKTTITFRDIKEIKVGGLGFDSGGLYVEYKDKILLTYLSRKHDMAAAAALYALRDVAKAGNDDKDFEQRASIWRSLAAKPSLTDEINKHRILAENAIREKNFASAIEHYETAFEIDPCWPAGQFNCAVIAAETGNYLDAAFHMKCYLALVPDAPDVQAAREKMIIWEEKGKRTTRQLHFRS
jgi:tetratricopeptide (TPR) repeat protein